VSVQIGQSLLHYRIVEKIGEGGMGVVWKAADTTLNRDVAIKVLPPGLAQDSERLARFEREAKVLASLNHANIASIYGLHEDGETRFLSMELVDGEDLAARLERGRLSIDEALGVARQVADALQSAHERGVVHRDLKPANILMTSKGKAKVLDFGLAKAFEPDPSSPANPSMSPTLTSQGTVAGMILGTAGYMSPEQARTLWPRCSSSSPTGICCLATCPAACVGCCAAACRRTRGSVCTTSLT
jgi:serine/threonine-protein kinase